MGKGEEGGSGNRFISGWFKFGAPARDPYVNGILMRVAVARGLNDVDHLLTCLGRQGDVISSSEALDIMVKEVGIDAFEDYVRSHYFSGRGNCENIMKSYKKVVEESGDDHCLARGLLKDLKKYCGYHGDGK